jgi:hypothetical protein
MDGWYEGVGDQARTAKEEGNRNRREGVGGKRMDRAGTDIGCQCARRVVQSSLDLELGAGVLGRSQESRVGCNVYAHSVDLKCKDLAVHLS